MVLTELDFPEEPEKPKKPLVERVNDRLKENMGERDPEITLEGIASSLGIGSERLNLWLENDGEFKKGLERFIKVDDTGLFRDEDFGNRADGIALAMLVMEMREKHKPK